eukprot:c21848_g1_i2 orf=343-561(+)
MFKHSILQVLVDQDQKAQEVLGSFPCVISPPRFSPCSIQHYELLRTGGTLSLARCGSREGADRVEPPAFNRT